MIQVAFYDAKPYDRPSFERFGALRDMRFRFLETKLNADTVALAQGCDAVCVFVNDTVNAEVIDKLYEYGVKLIALRSAGYNNVDVPHAFGKIHDALVVRFLTVFLNCFQRDIARLGLTNRHLNRHGNAAARHVCRIAR